MTWLIGKSAAGVEWVSCLDPRVCSRRDVQVADSEEVPAVGRVACDLVVEDTGDGEEIREVASSGLRCGGIGDLREVEKIGQVEERRVTSV